MTSREKIAELIDRALPVGAKLVPTSVALHIAAIDLCLLRGKREFSWRRRHVLESDATPRTKKDMQERLSRFRTQPPKSIHQLFAWGSTEAAYEIGKLDEKIPCPECHGDSPTQCATCEGVGKVACKRCEGHGILSNADALRACPNCKKGLVDCSNCRGSGLINCSKCENQHELWEVYKIHYKDHIEVTAVGGQTFAERYKSKLWTVPKDFSISRDWSAYGPPLTLEDQDGLSTELLQPRSLEEMRNYVQQKKPALIARFGESAYANINQALAKADPDADNRYAIALRALNCVTFTYQQDDKKHSAVGQIFFSEGQPSKVEYQRTAAPPSKGATCLKYGCGCLTFFFIIGLIGSLFEEDKDKAKQEGAAEKQSAPAATASAAAQRPLTGRVISVKNGYQLKLPTFALVEFAVYGKSLSDQQLLALVGKRLQIMRDDQVLAEAEIANIVPASQAGDVSEPRAQEDKENKEKQAAPTQQQFRALVQVVDTSWRVPADKRELAVGDLAALMDN
ncbi:MAG: hypothetical protein NZ552_02225 [Planctomycetes bacterium]|nr:hypothetical protein [Planctomycetota bacterium]